MMFFVFVFAQIEKIKGEIDAWMYELLEIN
jgi:hypothetical protein